MKEPITKNERGDWFEELYAKNIDTLKNIPWAKQKPNEALVKYLKNKIEKKSNALVIGCGLGDDAVYLEKFGFDVTAIDISPSALEQAKKRFPNSDVTFEQQDIFKMPKKYEESFDFIFEAYTIQSLPRDCRVEMITNIVKLLNKDAKILVVAHANEYKNIIDGPPWPLKKEEFETFENLSLTEVSFELYEDKSGVSPKKYKVVYEK